MSAEASYSTGEIADAPLTAILDVSRLSSQEQRIFARACRGLTDREIAISLNISAGSVRTYWERMRTKYRAKNRAHLLAKILTGEMLSTQ